ncbi:MAG: PQQ-binding-like beta-propeller repeat protein [Elusimicrobia bacterium]|nr:PQQ-binding-like beta-propeller repeat protein [Elusimicrobiota bacterium]
MENKKDRGSVLVITIIVSVILMITGIAYMYMGQMERIFSIREVRGDRAFYLAEAGIERVRSWMLKLPGTPEQYAEEVLGVTPGTDPFDPFAGWNTLASAVGGTGQYRIMIDPDNNNPGSADKLYNIISTGTADNVTQCLKTQLRYSDFTRFAYFSMNENNPNAGAFPGKDDRLYFNSLEKYIGPVHCNDQISVMGGYVANPTVIPTFFSTYPVTAGSNAGKYQVSTSSDIYFYEDGLRSSGGDGNTLDIALPAAQYPLVDRIEMFKDRNIKVLQDRAVLSLTGSPSTYTIILADDSLWYDPPGTNLTLDMPDPVVFSDADIYIRSASGGNFENWLTIAASGTIVIDGDIRYSTSTGPGMLGLVAANDIVIDNNSATGYELWSAALPGAVTNTPAVDEVNRAVYITNGATLYSLDMDDGSVNWSVDPAGAAIITLTSPSVHPGSHNIYVGGSNGFLYRITPSGVSSGGSVSAGGILTTPAINRIDGMIYVGASDNRVYRTNLACAVQGLPINAGAPVRSIVLDSNRNIYFGNDNNGISSYSWNFGINRWTLSIGAGGVQGVALSLDETRVYFTSTNGNVYRRAANNGGASGSLSIGSGLTAPAIDPHNGDVYVGAVNRMLYRIHANPASGIRWSYLRGGAAAAAAAAPAVSSATVFIGANDSYLYAVDLDGNLQWRVLTGGAITATPAVGTNGRVYVGSNDTDVHAIRARVSVDGFLMSFDSFRSPDRYSTICDAGLEVFGGLIMKTRRPFGRVRKVSGDVVHHGGFIVDSCVYDSRTVDNPPPYFPRFITGRSVNWQEKPKAVAD